jgi:hypothetical protein
MRYIFLTWGLAYFLTPILLHCFGPVANILLHRGMHDQFLTNRVAGQFTGEHVLVASLLVCILRAKDDPVVGNDLAVVLLDGV